MKIRYRPLLICLASVCLVFTLGCPSGNNNGPVPGETRTFDGIEFQWCPSGTYVMGSPQGEEGHDSDETQHQVTISHGFWLGKYEVTQSQWESVMGSNPSLFPGANRPVEAVSWEDVQDFIAALNTGKGGAAEYRLPTESEWEYACRAGTTSRFYWGEDSDETTIDSHAWYNGNSSAETHAVGEKLPNVWGLYDISGNVFEWCQDRYGPYPSGPVTDPQGPSSGILRVARGGSWAHVPSACRSAERLSAPVDVQFSDIGLRLVRNAD